MKRIVFAATGEPSQVLKMDESAVTQPGANEVRVRIPLRPVHAIDLAWIRGVYPPPAPLPLVAGSEGIGIVEAIGSGVNGIKIGQRYSSSWLSTWTEQLVLPSFMLMPVPDAVGDEIACQIRSNPITAYGLLQEAKPDGFIINNTADTSVGRMLIQLAGRQHKHLINLTRYEKDIPELEVYGARNVVATENSDWPQQVKKIAGQMPVVSVLDAVAGDMAVKTGELLTAGGSLINYGRLSGQPLSLTEEKAKANNINLRFFVIGEWMNQIGPEKRQQIFNELWDMLTRKELILPVAAIYPLSEFQQAILMAETPGTKGKVLLKS